jgi:hypothetical protein
MSANASIVCSANSIFNKIASECFDVSPVLFIITLLPTASVLKFVSPVLLLSLYCQPLPSSNLFRPSFQLYAANLTDKCFSKWIRIKYIARHFAMRRQPNKQTSFKAEKANRQFRLSSQLYAANSTDEMRFK